MVPFTRSECTVVSEAKSAGDVGLLGFLCRRQSRSLAASRTVDEAETRLDLDKHGVHVFRSCEPPFIGSLHR